MSYEAGSINTKNKDSLSFEVAIICLNAERIILNTILRLREVLPSSVSILVVDDGSSDSTLLILEKCDVRLIRHPRNLGRAQARQSALSNCEADILVFVDDDCYVDQDWFINLEKSWSIQSASTVGIGGPVRFREPLSYWGKYYEYVNPFSWNSALNKDAPPIFTRRLLTGNLSLKLSKIKEASIGFNTKIPSNLSGEDVVFSDEIIEHFGKEALFFDPSVVAKLSGSVSFREVRKRWIQNAKTEIPIRYSFIHIPLQDRLKIIVASAMSLTAIAILPFLFNLKALISCVIVGYSSLLWLRRKFIMSSILPAILRNRKTTKKWCCDAKSLILFIKLFAITNLGLIFSLYGKICAYLNIIDKPSDYMFIEKHKLEII